MTAHPISCDCQFTRKKPFRHGGFLAGLSANFRREAFRACKICSPGAPSLTAFSRHDSHGSLPSCLPDGSRLTHQCIPGESIRVFFDRGHFPNMVFTIFLFKCSDCTLWRSGTASLTTGTRNLQEEVGLRTCKFRVLVCIM